MKFITGIVILLICALAVISLQKKPVQVDESYQPIRGTQNDVFAIGDRVQMGDLILQVTSIDYSNGGPVVKPDSGKQYLHLSVTLYNNGSRKLHINNHNQLFVRDSLNNQYQLSITDRAKDNAGSGYFQQTLLPKSNKEMILGYEVPIDGSGFTLNYTPKFNSNVVKITL